MDLEISELFNSEQERDFETIDWFLLTQYLYEGTWFL